MNSRFEKTVFTIIRTQSLEKLLLHSKAQNALLEHKQTEKNAGMFTAHINKYTEFIFF